MPRYQNLVCANEQTRRDSESVETRRKMGIMPFFSDVQETVAQHQKYIAEFQELFRSNDVTFGAPEDFFRLAPRLAHDGSFREGFTALTKSVQDREEGRLTLTQMLTMIGVATGGQGIEQAGDAGQSP